MRKRLMLASGALLSLAAPTGALPCDYTADMPQRVYPLRDVPLPHERYIELEQDWNKYRESHPQSALAIVNWLRAKGYAQDWTEVDRFGLLQRAVELDPDCPEALADLANEEFGQSLRNGKPTMDAVRARLERATLLAPDWPLPHFYLFNIALLYNQPEGVRRELDTLVRKHGFSTPLLDYGHNILVSADPQSIVLTNGDNDTYPTLAVRDVFGVRPDVRIVNLSLLNLARYARSTLCGSASLPDPFTVDEIDSKQKDAGSEYVDARAIVASLIDKVALGTWKQPVYFASTVPRSTIDEVSHQELQLEGLLYRVLPATASRSSKVSPFALEKTDSLLTQVFRLESTTDFNYPWGPDTPIGPLMWNYFALWYRSAVGYAEKGDLEGVRRMLRPAVAWLDFHPELRRARAVDPLPQLLEYWKGLDPDNPEVDRLMHRSKD